MLTLTLALMIAQPLPTFSQDATPTWQQQRRMRREGGGFLARRRGGGDGGDGGMERRGGGEALPPGSALIRYGDSEAQRIRFWPAPSNSSAGARPPIAVYIHGGGWQHGTPEMVAEKPAWFAAHGWAFASVGYRLMPEAPVEQQAADVGAAIRQLRSEAAARGFDPDRILLIGHSAGAHLTALVATNPAHAGDGFAAIRGAIPIDGAAYDVVQQMRDGGRFMMQRTYVPVFGTDPDRQRALSPTSHVGGPDAVNWLILFDSGRDDAVSQSARLASGLERAGVRVQQQGIRFDDRNVLQRHRRMNVEFGTPGYEGNVAVEAMMRRIEG
jgi:acetyl esterase/lipase